MDLSTTREFSLSHPFASAAEVVRSIFLAPRAFYLSFSEEGPVREPAVFVAFVTAVTAILRLALTLIFGSNDVISVGLSLVEALAFVVLSPAILAVVAGAYLLSVRTFVGKVGSFRGVYRMIAYAYGAMILFWIPVVNAFAFTYFALLMMVLAVRYVHRTSLMTAVVTALVGYVPTAVLFIFLQIAVTGLAFGSAP